MKYYEVGIYLALVVPVLIVFYLAFLLFIRPPRKVLLASLLGGVVQGIVNILIDIVAYYAHWWHYTLRELILHVPLPFYISTMLVFGSLAYLLIWRFWPSRARWFSLLLLFGVPLFCILRDINGGLAQTSYQTWENIPLAIVATIGMWVVGFYAGFGLFWPTAVRFPFSPEPQEEQASEQREEHA